jgi:hypothetical protein
MNDWIGPSLALLTMLASGGLIGAWLTHRRLAPLSAADVNDRDWQRFQGEITRLDNKVRAHEERIEYLEGEVEKCHEEKRAQADELVRLRAIIDQEGSFRDMAQAIVSAERTGQPIPQRGKGNRP